MRDITGLATWWREFPPFHTASGWSGSFNLISRNLYEKHGYAVVGDPTRSMMARFWQSLLIDWQQKTQQIIALERDIAILLLPSWSFLPVLWTLTKTLFAH